MISQAPWRILDEVPRNGDLLAAALRTRRPVLIYGARWPKAVLDRVNASVTIDAREGLPDLDAIDPKKTIALLLPAELSERVEDLLDDLGEEIALVAVTPAHRISPSLERAFPFRLAEEQIL
jgi:hypothetical protein